jgi:hypothetical protein
VPCGVVWQERPGRNGVGDVSDRDQMVEFVRRAVRNGTPVDGRTVGYLLADYDRLLAAAKVVLDEDRDDASAQDRAKEDLRAVVRELT